MFQPKHIIWLYMSLSLFVLYLPSRYISHAFHLPATSSFLFSCLSSQIVDTKLQVVLDTTSFHSLACLPLFCMSEERNWRRLKPSNVLLSLKWDWRTDYHLVFPQWILAHHVFKLTIAQSPFSDITRAKPYLYDGMRHNILAITYSKLVQ